MDHIIGNVVCWGFFAFHEHLKLLLGKLLASALLSVGKIRFSCVL